MATIAYYCLLSLISGWFLHVSPYQEAPGGAAGVVLLSETISAVTAFLPEADDQGDATSNTTRQREGDGLPQNASSYERNLIRDNTNNITEYYTTSEDGDSELIFGCDFESEFCLSDMGLQLSWVRTTSRFQNRTAFQPTSDVTSYSGHYMMVDVTGVNQSEAAMGSEYIVQKGHRHYCLSYWYSIYGESVNTLAVYMFFRDHVHPGKPLWQDFGSKGPYWYKKSISFRTEGQHDFLFVFAVRQEEASNGTISVDKPQLVLGTCYGPEWQDWGEWSQCSVQCDNGTQNRTRICDGYNCTGPGREEKVCIQEECTEKTEWSEWTAWGKCGVRCGQGRQHRSRQCRGDCTHGRTQHESQLCDAGKCTGEESGEKCGKLGMFGVIGGYDAEAGGWPWHVGLYRQVGTRIAYTCGATIVHKRYVITAAHCVFEKVGDTHYRRVKASLLHIRAGSYRIVQGVKYYVEQVIPFPKYRYLVPIYDIALLRLNKDIEFNANTGPLCLPPRAPKKGDFCHTIGWGRTSTDSSKLAVTLQEVQLEILSRTTCKWEWGRTFINAVFCAGDNPREETVYKGDSGGPFICNENGVYHLQGVTSLGDPEHGRPAVFTDVWFFNKWIQEVLED